MEVLFLNHKIINCGVYQYGKRVYDIIQNSSEIKYIYYEIDNIDEYNNVLHMHRNISHIIYNYHKSTMQWLTTDNINTKYVNVGIIHESPYHLFDVVCDVDPDLPDDVKNKMYSLPRPIFEDIENIIMDYKYTNNDIKSFIEYKEPNSLTIGSFGFGFKTKGFDKIVEIINSQFKHAVIKFIIPVSHYDHQQYNTINECINDCNALNKNPNIKIMFYNLFVTNEELLLFLHSNDINIFLYDTLPERSISSCIDYALSVKKPLVISNSQMFKHIYNDDICVYKNDITTCAKKSIDYCKIFLEKYSHKNLINKLNLIIKNTLPQKLYKNTNTYKLNVLTINSVFYYYKNNCRGDVTDIFKDMYVKYLSTNSPLENSSFVINNHLFKDTIPCVKKILYINISINNVDYTFSANEDEVFYFDKFIDSICTICSIKPSYEFPVRITQGEIIDKYSIKFVKEIQTKDNLDVDIDFTNDTFQDIPCYFIKKYTFFYKLLCKINKKIIENKKILETIDIIDINNINFLETSYNVNKLSYELYVYDKIKNSVVKYFNIFIGEKYETTITESNSCYIKMENEEEFYNKISVINYLCLIYDNIYFDEKYKSLITNIFVNPNIQYCDVNCISNSSKIINLSTYDITNIDITLFDFDPIIYVSGGKLGDFINQLSVINEYFYKTGRKGILYIKELEMHGDRFTTGYIQTYHDTYKLIQNQRYIREYKIYNNEKYHIDLSYWRHTLDFSKNWKKIFNENYFINWGSHKWIDIGIDTKWNDTIIINITSYRFIGNGLIELLKNMIDANKTSQFYFISFDNDTYNNFIEKTRINIPLYKLETIEELATIINSCKFAYMNLSAMQVLCNSVYKDHIIFISNVLEYKISNLLDDFNHIKQIYTENI